MKSADIEKVLVSFYQQACLNAEKTNKEKNKQNNPNFTGALYETVIRDFLNELVSMYPDFDLEIHTGKIYRDEKTDDELYLYAEDESNQIDCFLCQKGKAYYLADGWYGCSIDDVIASIEVKKNVDDQKDFDTSMDNCLSVSKLVALEQNLLLTKEGETSNSESLMYECFEKFGINSIWLRKEYIMDYRKPLTMVFGFDGYAKEETIRKKYVEFIGKKIVQLDDDGRGSDNYYLLPDIYFEGKNIVMKMDRIINGTNYGNDITWISSVNNVDEELKFNIFRLLIIETIAYKLNIKTIFEKINETLYLLPFTYNPLVDFGFYDKKNPLCLPNFYYYPNLDLKKNEKR